MKRPLYILAPVALVLGLALNACSSAPTVSTTPAPTTTTPQAIPSAAPKTTTAKPAASPAAQTPKYGGTINFALSSDISSFNDATEGSGPWPLPLVAQELWGGDWTKGPAGGYGTNETAWDSVNPDVFAHKAGFLAESWQVNVDNQSQQATIVYKIRPGVRWALNPNNEMSRLIGGRELTADDVLTSIKLATTDSRHFIYRTNPELRNIEASKTGPMEITVKVPLSGLVTAMSRFGDSLRIYAVEVRDKDNTDWKNLVGTGPFILTSYVAGSSLTFVKNPNYWMKDPIGPGKGNQLPYLDGVQQLIIPDLSTRLTAFRTGKIDQIASVNWEDANQLKKEFPQMPSAEVGYSSIFPMNMRTDKAPYSDVRVRRALIMATDFNTIKQSINGGLGIINTYPYEYYKEYADLYIGVDDPDLPASVKELFVYSPDKAKKLLAEAGYPNGFKTSIMTTSNEASYYEMIASMWSKIGVNLGIDVRESGAIVNIANTHAYNDMIVANGKGPVAIYYTGQSFSGTPGFAGNVSFVNDPYIEETLPKLRTLAATNEKEAMKLARQIGIYALDQAWAIPRPGYRPTTLWWPWLKNYAGEMSVGGSNGVNWSQWVWIDQQLKQSMGR